MIWYGWDGALGLSPCAVEGLAKETALDERLSKFVEGGTGGTGPEGLFELAIWSSSRKNAARRETTTTWRLP